MLVDKDDTHEEQENFFEIDVLEEGEDVFSEDTQDYEYEDILSSLDKEKLMELTKDSIEKERLREANINKVDPALLSSRSKEFAANIVEWVYISAQAGEWDFTYGMDKVEEEFLRATANEVKKLLPDVMVITKTGKGRYINVSWRKSNEV